MLSKRDRTTDRSGRCFSFRVRGSDRALPAMRRSNGEDLLRIVKAINAEMIVTGGRSLFVQVRARCRRLSRRRLRSVMWPTRQAASASRNKPGKRAGRANRPADFILIYPTRLADDRRDPQAPHIRGP